MYICQLNSEKHCVASLLLLHQDVLERTAQMPLLMRSIYCISSIYTIDKVAHTSGLFFLRVLAISVSSAYCSATPSYTHLSVKSVVPLQPYIDKLKTITQQQYDTSMSISSSSNRSTIHNDVQPVSTMCTWNLATASCLILNITLMLNVYVLHYVYL
jgi:hypothetical protein